MESPYGSVVKRKCISLHQLQYFNVFCALDYKPLLYKGRWQYYYLNYFNYVLQYIYICIYIYIYLSGVPAWGFIIIINVTVDPISLPLGNPFKSHEEVLYL